MKLGKLFAGAAVALALALTSGAAPAQTNLRIASALGPKHVSSRGADIFLDKLHELTDGRYTGENFPSGLVTVPEILTAVRDGVVDSGNLAIPYFPAELVETNLPSELGMLSGDAVASTGASTEYIFSCAECQAELKAFNGIYLAGEATVAYQILATVPVRTVEDMKGLKIRTGAAAHARWAESLGAIPTQIPAGEIFEALSQGIVQAAYSTLADYRALQISDAAKFITLTNLGTFNGVSPFTLRSSVWESLSKEDKAHFLEAAQWGAAEYVIGYQEDAVAGRELGVQSGVEFTEIGDDFKAANRAFLDADNASIEKTLTEKGVANAGEKIARYKALLEKWTKLSEGVDTREEFVDLMMSEVISKLDLDTYGM